MLKFQIYETVFVLSSTNHNNQDEPELTGFQSQRDDMP